MGAHGNGNGSGSGGGGHHPGSPNGRTSSYRALTPEAAMPHMRAARSTPVDALGGGGGTPGLVPLPPSTAYMTAGKLGAAGRAAAVAAAAAVLPRRVEVTPCSHVPGARVLRYLGCVNMSFIRESLAVRQGGGLSSFMHALVGEANAVVRGHAAAEGGNAVLNYRLTPRETTGRAARNQAYHLITISGDVAEVVWVQ
jgi:hypothetical protein